jgi:aspartate/tyrosine/aromatic aminotransferase
MCEVCVTGRNGAEFLQRVLGYKVAYYSDPTWGNHGLIFRNANFTDVRKHQYWDEAAKGLNFRHAEPSRSSSVTNSAFAAFIF